MGTVGGCWLPSRTSTRFLSGAQIGDTRQGPKLGRWSRWKWEGPPGSPDPFFGVEKAAAPGEGARGGRGALEDGGKGQL